LNWKFDWLIDWSMFDWLEVFIPRERRERTSCTYKSNKEFMRKVMEMRSYNDKLICCFRLKQCNTFSITNLGERWTTSTVRLSHTMCECFYLFFSASLILLVLLSWGVNELLSIIECFFSFFINSFCLIDHLLNSSICLFLAQFSLGKSEFFFSYKYRRYSYHLNFSSNMCSSK